MPYDQATTAHRERELELMREQIQLTKDLLQEIKKLVATQKS